MRILLLTSGFPPRDIGGTEIYARYLGLGLIRYGCEVLVAFHSREGGEGGNKLARRGDGPLTVVEMPPIPGRRERRVRVTRAPAAAPGFTKLLEDWAPDVVHFHGFAADNGLTHLQICQQLGIKTVYTMHTPGQWCAQSNLLYRGRRACDGWLDQRRCSDCRLRTLGVPGPVAAGLARLPVADVGVNSASQLGRLLTVPATVQLHRESWEAFYAGVDAVQALAEWVVAMVELNDLPTEKMALVRTGVPWLGQAAPSARQPGADGVDVVFIGRFTETKGPDVLIEAVRSLPPQVPIRAHFWSANAKPDTPFRRRMLGLIESDDRLMRPESVPQEEVVPRLARMDVCVVPSIWLETGPLTVLEAFAAGVPVLGSRLGGIPELVRDGVDGQLFEPRDSAALAGLLKRLAQDPAALEQLRANVRPPRTMDDVAGDTLALYETLLPPGRRSATGGLE